MPYAGSQANIFGQVLVKIQQRGLLKFGVLDVVFNYLAHATVGQGARPDGAGAGVVVGIYAAGISQRQPVLDGIGQAYTAHHAVYARFVNGIFNRPQGVIGLSCQPGKYGAFGHWVLVGQALQVEAAGQKQRTGEKAEALPDAELLEPTIGPC